MGKTAGGRGREAARYCLVVSDSRKPTEGGAKPRRRITGQTGTTNKRTFKRVGIKKCHLFRANNTCETSRDNTSRTGGMFPFGRRHLGVAFQPGSSGNGGVQNPVMAEGEEVQFQTS